MLLSAMTAHHDEGQQAQQTPDEPDKLAHMKNPWRLRTEQQEQLGKEGWLGQPCTMGIDGQPCKMHEWDRLDAHELKFGQTCSSTAFLPLFAGLLLTTICKQSDVSVYKAETLNTSRTCSHQSVNDAMGLGTAQTGQ